MQTSSSPAAVKRQKESNFGIQSLADTLEAAFGTETQPGDSRGDNARAHATHGKRNLLRAARDSSQAAGRELESCKSSPPRTNRRDVSTRSLSNSLSPMPTSARPSTPTSTSLQSFKLSDEDTESNELTSQEVVAPDSGDEDETTLSQSGSFPQLVMPSIQMPSRRPFTTKGKAMGKLKVLVAGRAGTSLLTYSPRVRCPLV